MAAPPSRAALLEGGISALVAGRYNDAIQPLLAARKLDTNEPAVYLALGTAFLQERRFAEAAAAFDDALAICRPGSDESRLARSGIAICLLSTGDFQRAAASLEKKLASDPHASVVRACLAYALLKLGRPAEAAAHAARLKNDPLVDSFALAVCGAALLESGAAADSVETLRKALARCPGPVYEPSESALVIGPFSVSPKHGPMMQVLVLRPGAGQIAVEPRAVPAGTRSVAFYLDGSLRQATNQAPFHFNADGGLPPGLHTAALEAYDGEGRMLASAAASIAIPGGNTAHGDPEILAKAVERLAPLVRPLPDRAALHYTLGRALERAGRLAQACREYEACFAIRPDHPGAMPRLMAAYGRLHISAPTDRAIRQGVRKKPPTVALTFDDGPHPFFTPRLLEILRRNRIRATFFLVGSQVLSYPDLAKQIADEGHEIGNHTFTHPNLNFLTPTAIQQEILRAKLALRQVADGSFSRPNRDQRPSPRGQSLLFRPPGGRYGQKERRAVAALGYRTVFWTSNIYSAKVRDPAAIAARMTRELRAGGIALMHNGRDETLKVLPLVIDRLQRKGVRFVTVSDLSRADHRNM